MDKKYRKMLKVMEEKERFSATPGTGESWFLYILRCNDGTFYTGITKDLERRLAMHDKGKAACYTRTRRPVTLCYTEVLSSRTEALVRECWLKALTRQQKKELITEIKIGRGRMSENRGHFPDLLPTPYLVTGISPEAPK